MPGEFLLPPSLASATDLVGNFMRREERADGLHSVRTPVLLFSGPRGIGKTRVLYQIRDQLTGVYPCAYLDGEWLMESTWEMLLLLSFELNQLNDRSEYETLSFPRLTTGAIVITANLALDPNRAAARRQISDLLAAHRKTKSVLENTVTTLAKGAAQALMPYSETAGDIASALAALVRGSAAEALLGAMARRRRGRAALFGTGQQWWGQPGPGLPGDPFDKLVTLRQDADWGRARPRDESADPAHPKVLAQPADPSGHRAARARVTGLLWSAFLADLQQNFADRRRAVNWTRNCVVLLDNADATVARLFLTQLTTERARRPDVPDPLTVVVTSRGGLIQPGRRGGLTPLAQAGWEHYRQRSVPQAGPWWYPVALPAIDWQETSDLLAALELAGTDPGAVTTAVYALAGGHLGATRTLVAALAESAFAGDLKLAALLTAPEPQTRETGKRTVQQAILDSVLASLGEEYQAAVEDMMTGAAVEDLVTCAAARHREAALRLATEPRLMQQLPGGTAIFAAEFWRPDPAGVPAFLYPVTRRLLLRRLAAREPGRSQLTASWAGVHAWLRRRARLDGKEGAELYHTLALAGTPPAEIAALLREMDRETRVDRETPTASEGVAVAVDPLEQATPLEYVTRQLVACLTTVNAREWLDLVAHVTAAPNRLDHLQAPRDQVRELTSWAHQSERPIGPVARYVARSWLGADPLSAPHWRQLLAEMAKELDLFAEYSNDVGLAVLRDEADRYREIAADWRETAEFWMTRVTLADEANRRADQ